MVLSRFSETDTRLLITLCNEMTSEDACITSGISFEYGRKRIRHLLKQGWIRQRHEGSKYYYRTNELPELEHFHAVASTVQLNSVTFRIPNFYGQNLSVIDAIQQETTRLNNTKGAGISLPLFVGYIVNTIRRRSYRKHIGEHSTQQPDLETMKRWLEIYINQTRRNLRLAEEVLSCRKLWEESPATWKWINEEPPGEAANKQAEIMFRLYNGEQ